MRRIIEIIKAPETAGIPEKQKQISKAGHLLAKRLIAEFSGNNENTVSIEKDSFGKPFCPSIDAYFSISHSGEYIVCAVSDSQCGIDIQKTAAVSERVMKRVLSKKEYEAVTEAGGEQTVCERFIRLWTIKEAYLKCTGKGIFGGLDELEFLSAEDDFTAYGCCFMKLQAPDNYLIYYCEKA